MFIGDFAGTPLVDLGVGSPSAVAHSEPEALVVAAEGKVGF